MGKFLAVILATILQDFCSDLPSALERGRTATSLQQVRDVNRATVPAFDGLADIRTPGFKNRGRSFADWMACAGSAKLEAADRFEFGGLRLRNVVHAIERCLWASGSCSACPSFCR